MQPDPLMAADDPIGVCVVCSLERDTVRARYQVAGSSLLIYRTEDDIVDKKAA